MTANRQKLLSALDAMIVVVSGWTILYRFGLVPGVGSVLELHGVIISVPGLRILFPLAVGRLLLTPGFLQSLLVHRYRPGWGIAVVLLAGVGAVGGVWADRLHHEAQPSSEGFFPKGRDYKRDQQTIRDGYLCLYRFDPKLAPGLTWPDQARTLETHRFLKVGYEPCEFTLPAGEAARRLEILYSYVNWEWVFDPSMALPHDLAPSATLEVHARHEQDQPWLLIARVEIDPHNLFWSWFEPLPEGREWLRWMPLQVDLTGWTSGDLELSISATGPGASRVVVAAMPPVVPRPSATPADTAPRRIILISLDTLAAGRVGHLGHSRDTTPNLDRFAADSTTFTQAYAAAPWTTPSHWCMLTGLAPSFHGVFQRVEPDGTCLWRNEPYPPVATLADRLSQAGYRTAAFTGGYTVSAIWGFYRGFESLHETWQVYPPGRQEPTEDVFEFRKDVEVNVLAALGWIREHQDEPFFLFFHTFEPHSPSLRVFGFDDAGAQPYEDPTTGEPYFPNLEERLALLYDGDIRNADRWLGYFLDKLDDMGLLDDALVIVTSDHGESFRYRQLGLGTLVRNHGRTLHDEELHVPLVIRFPKSSGLRPERIDAPATTMDIFWTVLDCAQLPGRKTPGVPRLGRGWSLLPLAQNPAAADPERHLLAEANTKPPPNLQAVRHGRYKYIRAEHPQRHGPPEILETLFDLAADPDEEHSLLDQLPAVAQEMRSELKAYRAAVDRYRSEADQRQAAPASESPEQDLPAQLRGMGYF